jgi:hypothetical protein
VTAQLSEADIERIATRLSKGGASVTVQDPRVNTITRWVATLMGSIAVLVMVWVAASINRLNETMSRVVTQNESVMRTIIDHSERLRDLERRNAGR